MVMTKKELNEYKRLWKIKDRKDNPEKHRGYAKKSRVNRKDKNKVYIEKWREINSDKILEYRRSYNKQYYEKMKFVIKIRNQTWKLLREDIYKKFNSMCCKCGSSKKLEIHHDKYVVDINYIRLLCMNCHRAFHQRPR